MGVGQTMYGVGSWSEGVFVWVGDELGNPLMDQLEGKGLIKEGEDRWLWKEGESSKYTIKSAYSTIRKAING